MNYQDLFLLLKSLNIPVAYDHFSTNKEINPPFIIYRMATPNTFKADCETYYRPYNYEIELVTEKKDIELEESIEELLTNNKIPYDVDAEIWDDDERIFHNFYEI